MQTKEVSRKQGKEVQRSRDQEKQTKTKENTKQKRTKQNKTSKPVGRGHLSHHKNLGRFSMGEIFDSERMEFEAREMAWLALYGFILWFYRVLEAIMVMFANSCSGFAVVLLVVVGEWWFCWGVCFSMVALHWVLCWLNLTWCFLVFLRCLKWFSEVQSSRNHLGSPKGRSSAVFLILATAFAAFANFRLFYISWVFEVSRCHRLLRLVPLQDGDVLFVAHRQPLQGRPFELEVPGGLRFSPSISHNVMTRRSCAAAQTWKAKQGGGRTGLKTRFEFLY